MKLGCLSVNNIPLLSGKKEPYTNRKGNVDNLEGGVGGGGAEPSHRTHCKAA